MLEYAKQAMQLFKEDTTIHAAASTSHHLFDVLVDDNKVNDKRAK